MTGRGLIIAVVVALVLLLAIWWAPGPSAGAKQGLSAVVIIGTLLWVLLGSGLLN